MMITMYWHFIADAATQLHIVSSVDSQNFDKKDTLGFRSEMSPWPTIIEVLFDK